jgi:hypothetical protein
MNLSVKARWILLALAGLLVAVAVAVAASKVTSQRIGLASEPLQAGQELAPGPPRADQADAGPRHHGGRGHDADRDDDASSPPPSTTAPSTAAGTTTPDENSETDSTEVEGADD